MLCYSCWLGRFAISVLYLLARCQESTELLLDAYKLVHHTGIEPVLQVWKTRLLTSTTMMLGANDGTWTHMIKRSIHFKCTASPRSATSALCKRSKIYLQGWELNPWPSGYEPAYLPLIYPAVNWFPFSDYSAAITSNHVISCDSVWAL